MLQQDVESLETFSWNGSGMAASLSFSFPGQLSYMDDSSLTHILSYDQLPRSCTFYLICVHLLGVFASSLCGKAAGSGLQRGDVLPEKVEMLLTSRCPASRSSSGAVLQEQELRGAGQGLSGAGQGLSRHPAAGRGRRARSGCRPRAQGREEATAERWRQGHKAVLGAGLCRDARGALSALQ